VITLLQADARRLPLADGSVHCIATSPPYLGLRQYAGATWEGGDPECDHIARVETPRSSRPQPDGENRRNYFGGGTDEAQTGGRQQFRSVCGKCGARRAGAQIGQEERHDCQAWTRGEILSDPRGSFPNCLYVIAAEATEEQLMDVQRARMERSRRALEEELEVACESDGVVMLARRAQ
jgi:hypothetical protein